jgi:hypothetical protein
VRPTRQRDKEEMKDTVSVYYLGRGLASVPGQNSSPRPIPTFFFFLSSFSFLFSYFFYNF